MPKIDAIFRQSTYFFQVIFVLQHYVQITQSYIFVGRVC